MALFPEPYVVSHEPVLNGGIDDWGNPSESYGTPAAIPVYGWASATADAAIRALGTGVKHDVDLFCSTAFCGHRDRVTLPGNPGAYLVEGEPENFNTGPFGFMPGYRVSLKKVEG